MCVMYSDTAKLNWGCFDSDKKQVLHSFIINGHGCGCRPDLIEYSPDVLPRYKAPPHEKSVLEPIHVLPRPPLADLGVVGFHEKRVSAVRCWRTFVFGVDIVTR